MSQANPLVEIMCVCCEWVLCGWALLRMLGQNTSMRKYHTKGIGIRLGSRKEMWIYEFCDFGLDHDVGPMIAGAGID